MWLLELLGFSFVIGTVVGLVWHFGEEWLERRDAQKQLEAEVLMGGEEEDDDEDEVVVQPVSVSPAAPTTTNTKSN